MSGLVSPYDEKLGKLKERRDKWKEQGKDKKLERVQGKLSNVRSKKYLWQQENAPAEPMPHSAAYDNAMGAATRNRAQALGANKYSVGQVKANYGFDNPGANPYSKAALLQKSYDQTRAGSINSAAASGQLYSGSLQNRQNADLQNFGSAQHQLRTNYEQELFDLGQEWITAKNQYETDTGQAETDRAEEAANTPAEDPGPTPPAVKQWTNDKIKRYLTLKTSGKNVKAADIKAELEELGVWDKKQVKKIRDRMKKNNNHNQLSKM